MPKFNRRSNPKKAQDVGHSRKETNPRDPKEVQLLQETHSRKVKTSLLNTKSGIFIH
jgi:hypothetical protein